MKIKCRGFEGLLVSCECDMTNYLTYDVAVYTLRLRLAADTYLDMYNVRQSEIEVIPCNQ